VIGRKELIKSSQRKNTEITENTEKFLIVKASFVVHWK